MAEVVLTERFVGDAAGVASDRALAPVRRAVGLLGGFPGMGSPDLPTSVRREFGGRVRKYVVPPFDLVYEYDAASDRVVVHGLVPCRAAR